MYSLRVRKESRRFAPIREILQPMAPDLVFPAEKAKQLRDDPIRRYNLAVRYLPLPGAFREAAKALRAQIRERRRNDEPHEDLLTDLHRLACVQALVFSQGGEDDERLRHLFHEALPRSLWRSTAFPYEEVGTAGLDLLKKTDRKWMEQAWGKPHSSAELRAVAPNLWQRLLEHDREVGKRAKVERERRIARQMSGRTRGQMQDQQGCLAAILAFGGLLIVLLMIPIVLADQLFSG